MQAISPDTRTQTEKHGVSKGNFLFRRSLPLRSLFVKMRKARTRTQLGQPSESEARIAAATSRGSRENSTMTQMTSWRQVGLERLESSSSLQRTPCALGQAAGAIVESHT